MKRLNEISFNTEFIRYLIIGILTTVINYISFLISTKMLNISWEYSNMIAWTFSVIFAFICNRNIVFNSQGNWKKECLLFFILRFFSLLVEFGILYIMIDKSSINEQLSKIITNIIVIVINYLFCNSLIFNK